MLEDAGLDFKVFSSDIDEDILKQKMAGMPFEKQVVKLASAKAEEVSINNQDHIVIGGDQMCICNNTIFDKPGSVASFIRNNSLSI
jgi:septum formation protein